MKPSETKKALSIRKIRTCNQESGSPLLGTPEEPSILIGYFLLMVNEVLKGQI